MDRAGLAAAGADRVKSMINLPKMRGERGLNYLARAGGAGTALGSSVRNAGALPKIPGVHCEVLSLRRSVTRVCVFCLRLHEFQEFVAAGAIELALGIESRGGLQFG
jgi:hypothetical protein